MNVIRAAVGAQASRMLEVLERQWPGSAARLHADPLAEVGSWSEVQVTQVPDTQADSRCSVAGGYLHTTIPPTLTVTRSLSVPRRQFTVLHELGHHLQKHDSALALEVRRQKASREAFEDAACDAFAARVLLPDAALNFWPEGRAPSAADVVELYGRTQASRAACCVRAAERLGSPGVVAVLSAEGTVTFAAGHGDVFPPARGSNQAMTPLVRAAIQARRDVRLDATHVLYRNGSTSVDLYGDAAWTGDYLLIVAVFDRPSWKAFAPPRSGTGNFVSGEVTCEACEAEFEPTGTCAKCGVPRCPTGHCTCTLAAERQCQRCFNLLHPNRFAEPAAQVCKDCAA
jgi:Zn-dependent peptidase ImmA (M78 family)